MNTRPAIASLAFALPLAACVPMEQASLTYTSKTTMGVGVAAGTQDTPGLDVTIGFKESNVALVPVAVAKYCYKATEAQCQDVIYRMELVTGKKLDSVQNLPIQKRIDERNSEITALSAQQKHDTDRLAQLKADLATAQEADKAIAELQDPIFNADDPSEDVKSRRAALEAKAAQKPAGFDASAAAKDIGDLEAAQRKRTVKIEEFQKDLSQLMRQLSSNSDKDRTDAYSVYGKFSGGANGDSKGAGLTAGKVFATGVAAQNLTEFASVTECLSTIRFLAEMIKDTPESKTLIGSAGEVCRSS